MDILGNLTKIKKQNAHGFSNLLGDSETLFAKLALLWNLCFPFDAMQFVVFKVLIKIASFRR